MKHGDYLLHIHRRATGKLHSICRGLIAPFGTDSALKQSKETETSAGEERLENAANSRSDPSRSDRFIVPLYELTYAKALTFPRNERVSLK